MEPSNNILYDLIKHQDSDIETLKENVKDMHHVIRDSNDHLKEQIRQTQVNLESQIQEIRMNELNCPGKRSAEWNSGLMNKAKDVAILIGLLLTLLKLFKVIP